VAFIPTEIWHASGDGALIDAVFGHRPNLEDAVLREVAARANRVTLTVDVEEAVEGQVLRARLRLEFEGVERAEFSVRENRLRGFRMRMRHGKVEATFTLGHGAGASLTADEFTVHLERADGAHVDPLDDEIIRFVVH
jgi:hypothetical protein